MAENVYLPILVMALTTYLIRMLPLTLIRREIKNRFVRSFLHYVPFAALAAMTFPSILFSTSTPWSAAVGFAIALVLSYRRKSLITVALAACAAVFAAELFL